MKVRWLQINYMTVTRVYSNFQSLTSKMLQFTASSYVLIYRDWSAILAKEFTNFDIQALSILNNGPQHIVIVIVIAMELTRQGIRELIQTS